MRNVDKSYNLKSLVNSTYFYTFVCPIKELLSYTDYVHLYCELLFTKISNNPIRDKQAHKLIFKVANVLSKMLRKTFRDGDLK